MRKIINGKVYDTETAEVISTDGHGGRGDLYRYWEAVYRTKKGNWFLYRIGGALSIMSESNGRESYGTSDILPLSPEEAASYMEKHNAIEELEKYFPEKVTEA